MDILGHVRGSPAYGANTWTSCPRRRSWRAKSRIWFCTPPGVSNEYGQMMPTRSASCCPAVPLAVCEDGVFLSNDGILASCSTRWTFTVTSLLVPAAPRGRL